MYDSRYILRKLSEQGSELPVEQKKNKFGKTFLPTTPKIMTAMCTYTFRDIWQSLREVEPWLRKLKET